jgi:hypothetical protein
MKEFYVAGARAKPGNYVRGFRGWRFNPFNFYASWLYARQFGEAAQIRKALEGKLQPLPVEALLRQRPHVLNCYIAGCLGYLNLQDLAGVPRDARVAGWLAEALARASSIGITPGLTVARPADSCISCPNWAHTCTPKPLRTSGETFACMSRWPSTGSSRALTR